MISKLPVLDKSPRPFPSPALLGSGTVVREADSGVHRQGDTALYLAVYPAELSPTSPAGFKTRGLSWSVYMGCTFCLCLGLRYGFGRRCLISSQPTLRAPKAAFVFPRLVAQDPPAEMPGLPCTWAVSRGTFAGGGQMQRGLQTQVSIGPVTAPPSKGWWGRAW